MRRKVQNRKNQRAHRLRTRELDAGSIKTSRLFQVSRWRLDEFDDCQSQDLSSSSEGTIATWISPSPPCNQLSTLLSIPERTKILRGPPSTASDHARTSLTPPSLIFPLSTDHLLHLVQYNVFRAFVSNKSTLNLLLTGRTDKPSSPNTCPISGPYIDLTAVYPLNPNIPPSLVPTRLQQSRLHSLWINLFPFPRLRDNLIRREGRFDHWELLQDLIGELMNAIPTQERRGTPLSITVSDPKNMSNPPFTAGCDDDGVTAGRNGLIVWSEPHDPQSWEATPGFFTKWPWLVEGCDDLVESTNRWRLTRGEEPLRFVDKVPAISNSFQGV
ncbi:hypothetical protein FB567DRAFT_545993 [Paraphoma chrysanthemicola]|uniref:Uncharacterized protein n=1 Tax=Paraphoma chrysanthemicola TaxID=798071 RepID=A0A8K0RC00_9PLEO|nr:hypothetical protein FB567DRAFT_545993 [Paraphoma chrysanthemicola]